MTRPADYPPPFSGEDAIAAPSDADPIEVGLLIVGAGPAGLACAIRFGQLLEESPETAERLGEVPVAVLEKGKQPGSHLLSGAVVNPRALRRLFRGRARMDDMPRHGCALISRCRSSGFRSMCCGCGSRNTKVIRRSR